MPFEIVRNDITKMKVDAIVNAANNSLLGGGGVDGAIHAAAGPELLTECRTLGGCETGGAKLTKGYRLPAKYVIHTVGPVWQGGTHGEEAALTACYRNSLELAKQHACETIAFPLISAGAYGYPREEAISVAVSTISAFLLQNDMTVYLVVFGRESLVAGRKLFRDVQEYIDDVYVGEHLDAYRENSRRYSWRRKAAMTEELELMAPLENISYGAAAPMLTPDAAADLDELLRKTDKGFSETLLDLIDAKGMTDSECYKRANVDRKLFSKIRSNPQYKPSKPTAFAFAIALELDLNETEDLLRRAGYAITHSSKFDVIVEYFIVNGRYNIHEINEELFDRDMPLLGSGTF
ncbi:MAG: O-acetyl-ADP-ribose deacetylase [Clostridia bacterium]|nr:O-acetyl-ADP-ribose deacetylase [Clostridia bacterium]